MQEIVDRYNSDEGSPYLLPIIPNIKRKDDLRNNYKSELANVNVHLKKLSENLNLGFTITMNVARHSWALAAQSKKQMMRSSQMILQSSASGKVYRSMSTYRLIRDISHVLQDE